MLNIYTAESRVKKRQQIDEKHVKRNKSKSSNNLEQERVKNYERRVIQFIRDQVVKSAVINQDKDYETSQQQKLETTLRLMEPSASTFNPLKSKMVSSITSRAASNPKARRIGTVQDFENVNLDLSPTRNPRHCDSQQERIRRSEQAASFLDTEPSGNHSVVFQKLIRANHRSSNLDLGPGVIRLNDRTAERLQKVELGPFNEKLYKGFRRFENTRENLFSEEKIKWYMPEGGADSHAIEIHPRKKWERFLPIVREPKQLHSHLHNKTHFKASHEVYLKGEEKISMNDIKVVEMIKDIQRVVNKNRKAKLQKSFQGLIKKESKKMEKPQIENPFDQGSFKKFGSSLELLFKMGKTKKRDSDDEDDPPVQLKDFQLETRQMLQRSNVLRRASIQVRGPNQFNSQSMVFDKINSKNH